MISLLLLLVLPDTFHVSRHIFGIVTNCRKYNQLVLEAHCSQRRDIICFFMTSFIRIRLVIKNGEKILLYWH